MALTTQLSQTSLLPCPMCEETDPRKKKYLQCTSLLCDDCKYAKLKERNEAQNKQTNENQDEKVKLKSVECSIHSDEHFCNFCESCHMLVCPSCLVESHQMHRLRKMTDVYNDQIKKLEDYEDHIDKGLLTLFQNRITKLDEIKELQMRKYEEEKTKIKKSDARLKDQITNKTNKLLEDLDVSFQNTTEDINQERSRIEKIIQELNDKISCVNDAKSSNNIGTVRSVTDEVTTHLKEVNTSFSILPLQYKQFKEGKIRDSSITKAVGKLVSNILPSLSDFQVLKSYDTSFVEIGSLSTSRDGTVWISDWWGEFNKTIYQVKLDDELSVLKEKQLQFRGHICITKTGDMLVMFDKDPSIKILAKDGTLKNFYTFTGGLLRGPLVPMALHATNNNQVIISAAEKDHKNELTSKSQRQLIVVSAQGRELSTFEYDKTNNERLFTLPFRITSSRNGDKISVVDRISFEQGRIVTLNMDGKLLWEYKGQQKTLFDPCDIASTSRDNIIICDIGNQALHILNHEGQLIQFQQTTSLGIKLKLIPSMDIDNEEHLLIACGSQINVLKFTGC